MQADQLIFGEYRIDFARQELRKSGRRVEIPPLAFKLLRFLAANRDRTPTRDELLREIWGEVSVGENALHQALKNARRAVGDDGQKQAIIKTVRGLGYRFVATAKPVSASENEAVQRNLIGRADLLFAFEEDLAALGRGEGGAVFLTGEPGIGKTRALDAFESLLERRSANTSSSPPIVVRSHATLQDGAPPYWLWIGVFRGLGRVEELAELQAEMNRFVPTLLASAAGSPAAEDRVYDVDEAERFRIFDRVAQTLAEISRRHPLVFLLDDLHVAGPAALELMDFLVQELASYPFLIVGTVRSAEMLAGDSAELLARLSGRTQVKIREVEPLSAEETVEILEAHADANVGSRLIRRIARHSRGNPFFALELLRHAKTIERRRDPELTELDAIDSTLRWSLARMLGDRLRSLSTEACDLAHAAAVAGRKLDLDLLARVLGSKAIENPLEELIEKGLVLGGQAENQKPVFAHDLFHEACYADAASRADGVKPLHLRTAEALAASGSARPSLVAFHRAAADPLGDRLETIRWLGEAARIASASFDQRQARWAFGEALRIADQTSGLGPGDRCELLLAAGENAVRGIFPDEARGHLLGALRLARTAERWDWLARAALGLAARDEILGMPEEEVARILEEALSVCPSEEHALRARLLASLALKVRYSEAGLPAATRLIDEAQLEARRSGDASASAQVLEDASFIEWSVQNPEAWIELNHKIVEAATEARAVGLVFRGAKGLATGFLEVGDLPGALREMKRCAEIARTAPAPFLRAVVALHDGARSMLAGRFDEGEQHAIRAMGSGLPSIAPLAAVQIFCHRLEKARLNELESAVKNWVESAPGVMAWRYAWARVLVDGGRMDEARKVLHAAGSIGALPRDRNWLTAAVMATETAVALGDVPACSDLYTHLQPFGRVNVVAGHGSLCFGNLDHFLGELALAQGRPAEAREHWVRALEMHRKLACRPFVLKSEWGLLRCARSLGEEDGLLSAAEIRDAAGRFGMHRLVMQIDA